MEELYYSTLALPWTRLVLASSARGLVWSYFVSPGGEERARARLAAAFPQARLVAASEPHRRVTAELAAYASGALQKFTVGLDLRGTDFFLAVWRQLLKIPYGETRTYAEIAHAVGHPAAFRAVGLANGANPVAIIVPCHRVIGSNGRLVGYGGGLELKKTLLEHERRHAVQSLVPATNSLPLWE